MSISSPLPSRVTRSSTGRQQLHLSTWLWANPPSGLVLPGTVPQDEGTHIEDRRALIQYKREKLHRLCDVLKCAWTKLTAAQKQEKADFDKKVGFGRVVEVGGKFRWTDPQIP